MRRLIFAGLLCLPLPGADYYFSQSGNDTTGNGSIGNPYKTISKLNGLSCTGGPHHYYLKRGDTWAESMSLTCSGSAGAPVTVDAYGMTGKSPVVKYDGNAIGLAGRSYQTYSNLDVQGTMELSAASHDIELQNVFVRGHTSGNGQGLRVTGGSSVVVTGALITDNTTGVYLSGAGDSVTARNSSIVGNGMGMVASGGYGVQVSSGASFIYQNCHIGGNGRSTANNIYGTGTKTDGGGNLTDLMPGWRGWRYDQAYFVLQLDGDSTAYIGDNSENYRALLGPTVPFTVELTWIPSIPAGQITKLATSAAAGIEMGIHDWSHSFMDKTTAFQVSTTNTGTNTITVDRTAKTLTLTSTGNPGNNVTVDWSATDKTIANLKSAVSGKGWTISNTTGVDDLCRLKALGDQTSTTFPYTANFLMSAYYDEEVGDVISWAASNLGVTPVTGAVRGTYTAGIGSYMLSAGMIGNRNTGYMALSNLKVYELKAFSLNSDLSLGSMTEAQARALARHFVALGKAQGGIVCFYFHGPTDISDNQLTWFTDEVKKRGGTWYTTAAALTAIRADHSTSDGGYTYTKTYSDTSDFRLEARCPADAGVVPCYSGVDLGAAYTMGLDPRSATDVQTLDRTWFGWDIGPYVRIKRKVVGN